MEQYTQIPNIILDEWMRIMHASSFKTLMAICRKTLGWQKESDEISLSQIEELTGLPRKTVIRSTKDLEKRNLLIIDRSRKVNNYRLNLDSDMMSPIQDRIVTLGNQTSDKSTPDVSDMMSHTKEKKETITKENNNITLNDEINIIMGNYNIKNKYNNLDMKAIYLTWSLHPILQQHSEKTLNRNIKKRHSDIIKDIGIGNSKTAINNYAVIIANPNYYWYTHKFTFWRFLEKIDTFLDSADPLNNYRIKDTKQQEKKSSTPLWKGDGFVNEQN